MAELNSRLKERDLERSQSPTWRHSLFNLSPWLTTLLSALAGPLLLLLVACMVGPCIFTKVKAFLQQRLSRISEEVLLLKDAVETEVKLPLMNLASSSADGDYVASVDDDYVTPIADAYVEAY